MLAASRLMNNDARRSGKDNVPKLTGRQESNHPLLELTEANVETRADDATLVQTENVLAINE
jgi:hypothetical protein